MKNILKSSLVIAALGLSTLSAAYSSVSFTLTLPDALTQEVDISPGDSFSLRLQVVTDSELLTGVSYFFTISGAASGNISIASRTITGSFFTDLITSNGTALNAANALLDPTNNNDLGAIVDDPFSPAAAGTNFIATFTFQSTVNIPIGSFNLSITGVDVVDEDFNSLPFSSNQFTVNVIPEPTAAVFLGLGLLGLVARRRR